KRAVLKVPDRVLWRTSGIYLDGPSEDEQTPRRSSIPCPAQYRAGRFQAPYIWLSDRKRPSGDDCLSILLAGHESRMSPVTPQLLMDPAGSNLEERLSTVFRLGAALSWAIGRYNHPLATPSTSLAAPRRLLAMARSSRSVGYA